MQLKQGIAFCVCTYNRADYLQKCMDALVPQLLAHDSVLYVIDNACTDHTKEVVFSFINKNNPVVYVYESQIGLSYARNKGWKESHHEWIFYIDDDCLATGNFVSASIKLIEDYRNIDAFGGPVDPLYTSIPPSWLPQKFGGFIMPFEEVTIVEKGYIRGLCFLIRKQVLESLGGFNPALGMSGNLIKYAEELELQDRMRKVGLIIAYAPQLRIQHIVRPDKVNLKWILESEYAKRRDKMMFAPVSVPKASLNLTRTILSRMFRIPLNTIKVVTKRDYSWQKATLDSLIPFMYRWGEFKGSLKARHKKYKQE